MSLGHDNQLAAENPRLARVSRIGQTGRCPNQSRIGLLRTTAHILTTAVLAAGVLALLITISRGRGTR